MTCPRLSLAIVLGSVLAIGCSDDGGSTTMGTSMTGGGSTTGGGTTAITQTSTGNDTAATGTSSTSADTSTSSGTVTDTGSTTGVDIDAFERFLMSSAAGPCGPGADCDGFVELLGTGTLRVEQFGDVSGTVTEVVISDEDFAAAVLVFADPALLSLLDGPEPICDPPTDVSESMTVQIDMTVHEAATTACDDPPIAAAREMAVNLRTKYVP